MHDLDAGAGDSDERTDDDEVERDLDHRDDPGGLPDRVNVIGGGLFVIGR